MRRRSPLPSLLALAVCLAWPAAGAWAHPHVWVTAQASLRFERGAIAAVAMRWGFDPMFGEFVRGEYDKDGNGAFDPGETATVAAEAFSNLQEFDFLTHVTAGGQAVRPAGFRDFAVRVEGDAVVYEFVLPLARPVDPAAEPVKVAVYDDTFYIDVSFSAEDPVTFAGDAPPACTAKLAEDQGTTIYYGLVHPLAAELACPVS